MEEVLSPMVMITGGKSDTRLRSLLKQAGAAEVNRTTDANALIFEFPWRSSQSSRRYVQSLVRDLKESEAQHAGIAILVAMLSGIPVKTFFDVISTTPNPRSFDLVRTPEEAVSRVLLAVCKSPHRKTPSILDAVRGIEDVTKDLRGDDGRLCAKKVKDVFGLDTMAELAEAAGITRQALNDNSSTPAVIPVLESFEQVARLRALKQLSEAGSFRRWWRRKLPSLDNRSPNEAWRAGEIGTVVDLVDGLLTGETHG